ncbi:Imm26 family immunity protein [Stenotrophomonas sp. 3(2025)]|uniref:Imm26 family immunity protein n=1 Tax=Stenotrophomonas sp. 3(2025) TaxID=3456023 RepID=UPI0040450E9D
MAKPAPKRTKKEAGITGDLLNGWTKKHRTMLRFIRAGDIFCFTRNDGLYYFGQIIAKNLMGHSAHIFETRRGEPTFDDFNLEQSTPLMNPVILDSYSLFDRKIDQDGEWRIIGRHELVHAADLEQYFFVYGVPGDWSKVNATNSIHCPATEGDAMALPPLIALNNFKVWLAIDSLPHRWAE